jgi:hypothetical protein
VTTSGPIAAGVPSTGISGSSGISESLETSNDGNLNLDEPPVSLSIISFMLLIN